MNSAAPGESRMKQLDFIHRSHGRYWVGDGFPVQSVFSYRDIAAAMSPFLLFLKT